MDCKLVFLLACVAIAYSLPAVEESPDVTAVQIDDQVKAAVDSYLDNLFAPNELVADPSLASESNVDEEVQVREKRSPRKCYNYPQRDRFGRVTLRRICH